MASVTPPRRRPITRVARKRPAGVELDPCARSESPTRRPRALRRAGRGREGRARRRPQDCEHGPRYTVAAWRSRLHPAPRRRAPPAAARAGRRAVRRATRTPSSRWRGSRARPASRRRCSTTTSRASRSSSSPRSSRRAEESRARTEPDPACPVEALAEQPRRLPRLGRGERASPTRKLHARARAACPRWASLIDGSATRTSARILEGLGAGDPPPGCAPPRAPGCGSWTARSSTGSSTAT